MPSDITQGAARLTSTLNDAHNDTGRIAFCGPIVLSAITGYSVSKVEDEIRAFRKLRPTPAHRQGHLRRGGGSRACPLRLHHGAQGELHAPRPQGAPSLWSWMQKPRNAWVHYILAIHKGKEGHWVLIKGVKLCDTYSEGRWQFVCDGPHKGAASWRCSR